MEKRNSKGINVAKKRSKNNQNPFLLHRINANNPSLSLTRTAYCTCIYLFYICVCIHCSQLVSKKSFFLFSFVLFCSYAYAYVYDVLCAWAHISFTLLFDIVVCFFALLCLSAWYDIHLNHPSNSYTWLMGRLCCWCFRWIERAVLLLLLRLLLLLLLPLFQTHFEHACNNLMIHFTVSSLCNTTNQYTNFAVRWITLSRWNRIFSLSLSGLSPLLTCHFFDPLRSCVFFSIFSWFIMVFDTYIPQATCTNIRTHTHTHILIKFYLVSMSTRFIRQKSW